MSSTSTNKVSIVSSLFNGLDVRHREYFSTWAVAYLSKNSPAHAKAFEQYLESGNSDKLDKYLSKNNHKELFQNAWRQAKRRKFNKEQITLNLNRSDYNKLRLSATRNKMNMTQYLIKLINDNDNDEGLL
ncbi:MULTISPECIES: hypothetical protein [Pseudoalteromonas]|uniref:hypothetical protein n=1 Tax=Pseudoalteromonas TaxID=53246 RepID=UPI0002CC7197|nr:MULTISPECIES: hypothetical protein [Pseudoalteromonas]ENO00520.1 hypothetical protein J139_01366 [Pseudoalteromonas agarivorans S816]MDI3244997.1 hypothetical protein [Pseudoalteromonas agarivorans]TMS65291.1 hypothetical protein CWB83_13820 [Pseudoalteromonas sp. S1691]TMS70714.1 hypothetical protein CWB86_07280 [Pseudoalteromonas sp. S1731]TMS73294.1 hypothetical protein CWB88_12445 [Pseudoalteromonas sp. S1941]